MILIRCCLRPLPLVRRFGESRSVVPATTLRRRGRRLGALLTALGVLGVAAAPAAEFTLEWNDNSTNEDGFQVERALGSTGAFAVVGTVGANQTRYQDSGLEAETLYRYRVQAFNTAGSSAYSNTVTDTTPSVTVVTGNTAPTISSVPSQTVTSGSNGSVGFNVADTTTSLSDLKVIASTSEPHLVPQSSLTVSGTSSSRTLSFSTVRGIVGTAELTLAVHDGEFVTYRRFAVNVTGGSGTPPPAQALRSRFSQLSLLAPAGPGTGALDVQFTTQNASKSILVRAVGPTLASELSLDNALKDPRIKLFRGNSTVASNDNWGGAAKLRNLFTRLGAFALPNSSLDSASLATLTAQDYRLTVSGRDGQPSGRVLAEIYDADTMTAPAGRLTRLTSRTLVGTGTGAPVLGFTITSEDTRTVLIRAVSDRSGSTDTQAKPRLELYRNDKLLQRVEGWTPTADIIASTAKVGASDLTYLADASVLVDLAPGAYTVVISSGSGPAGVGSIELYEVR